MKSTPSANLAQPPSAQSPSAQPLPELGLSPKSLSQSSLLAKAPARVHLGYLDGLRGLAALYVVMFHIWGYHSAQLGALTARLVTPFCFGPYAVAVFIVLSGFCLMLPVSRSADGLVRGGAKRFFLSRAKRILPPYYFAVAFSLLLITFFIGHKTGSPWDLSLPVTSLGLVSHLLLFQDTLHATCPKINPALWSVSVEWRIYFCFPLFVWSWRRLGPWATTVAAFVVSYALVEGFFHVPLLQRVNSQGTGILPQYLWLFTLGMLAADIAFSERKQAAALRRRLPWGWMTAGTFMALLLATARIPLDMYGHPKLDFFVGLFALCLLVPASREGLLKKALSWKPLVAIGSFAYSLYLIHSAVIEMVWKYLVQPLHLGGSTGLLVNWLIGIPVAVGAAYGFHLAFERPFMSKSAPKPRRQAEPVFVFSAGSAVPPASAQELETAQEAL